MAVTTQDEARLPVPEPDLELLSGPAERPDRAGDRLTHTAGESRGPLHAVARDRARWSLTGLVAVTGFTLSAWMSATAPLARPAVAACRAA